MARASEIWTRVGLTVAVLGALVLALAFSGYDWNFQPVWLYKKLFFKGIGYTVAATALAFVIGLTLGVGVALARLSRKLAVRHLGDMYVELIRGTPFIVQIAVAYYGIATIIGVDDKFMIGSVALGMFAAAYIGEIFRAGIQSIDRGQFEAARSLGLSRMRTMRHVIFPQALRRMIPPLTGELLALTKESSLLYFIGLNELMSAAKWTGASNYKYFEAYLVVAAFYLTLTIPLSLIARRLERKLGKSEQLGAHL
jgi:polar amino acid transport system permease protein